MFGINIALFFKAWIRLPQYFIHSHRYKKLFKTSTEKNFPLHLTSSVPILQDSDSDAGKASGAYFHQDLWAARKIFKKKPKKHIDIGSRIDGFISHLLVFMPVDVIDIRPLENSVPGLSFIKEDATQLKRFKNNSINSLSSLHAVEHFGLGRYGGPVDPDASFNGIRSMARVLAPKGRLYLSVPIGRERLEFNAHRIFSPKTIIELCSDLKLLSFSAVTDDGNFIEKADLDGFSTATFACGLFEFTKPATTRKKVSKK